MIYIAQEADTTLDETHLWLEGMVEEAEDGPETELGALCGTTLLDLGYEHNHAIRPASNTWADGLIDLLGDNRLCEECRTRAAVYFDRQGEVTLKATSHEVPVCPVCEEDGREPYKRKAELTNIVSKEEGTVVERALECDECGHEWEDEVSMEAL